MAKAADEQVMFKINNEKIEPVQDFIFLGSKIVHDAFLHLNSSAG